MAGSSNIPDETGKLSVNKYKYLSASGLQEIWKTQIGYKPELREATQPIGQIKKNQKFTTIENVLEALVFPKYAPIIESPIVNYTSSVNRTEPTTEYSGTVKWNFTPGSGEINQIILKDAQDKALLTWTSSSGNTLTNNNYMLIVDIKNNIATCFITNTITSYATTDLVYSEKLKITINDTHDYSITSETAALNFTLKYIPSKINSVTISGSHDKYWYNYGTKQTKVTCKVNYTKGTLFDKVTCTLNEKSTNATIINTTETDYTFTCDYSSKQDWTVQADVKVYRKTSALNNEVENQNNQTTKTFVFIQPTITGKSCNMSQYYPDETKKPTIQYKWSEYSLAAATENYSILWTEFDNTKIQNVFNKTISHPKDSKLTDTLSYTLNGKNRMKIFVHCTLSNNSYDYLLPAKKTASGWDAWKDEYGTFELDFDNDPIGKGEYSWSPKQDLPYEFEWKGPNYDSYGTTGHESAYVYVGLLCFKDFDINFFAYSMGAWKDLVGVFQQEYREDNWFFWKRKAGGLTTDSKMSFSWEVSN